MTIHRWFPARPRVLGAVLGVILGSLSAIVLAAPPTTPVLADAVPPVAPLTLDALHQMLLGVIGVLSSIIAFLFYRLEASRLKLYEDARNDAAIDKQIAASLQALADRKEPRQ